MGPLVKYKGGKRADIGLISHRAKDHRLKVNASKSYPVHSVVLLLFSLTLPVPIPGQKEMKKGVKKR